MLALEDAVFSLPGPHDGSHDFSGVSGNVRLAGGRPTAFLNYRRYSLASLLTLYCYLSIPLSFA